MVTEPVLEIVAMKDGVYFAENRKILGNAFAKTAAIATPSMSPAVRTKARVPALISAVLSIARNRMRRPFVSTIHSLLPTSVSHVSSLASLGEMIVVNFNLGAYAAQCLGNRLFSEGTIKEESRRFRRLLFEARNGSLLRFHSRGGRSRPLIL